MDFKWFMEAMAASHSSYHAVAFAEKTLLDAGFHSLSEKKTYRLEAGQSYFVKRNDSSLIAFRIPATKPKRFLIASAHSDSPTFRVKPNPDMERKGLLALNVEGYGGMIIPSWLDRPLSIAGRVIVETEQGVETRLFDVGRDLCVVPNVAIHMNRDINSGFAYRQGVDTIPLFGIKEGVYSNFADWLKESLHDASIKTVLSHDLYLYVREEPRLFGLQDEFLLSPRLDDLSSAFSVLNGFLSANSGNAIAVYALFDNEEVGSLTRQGANSTFLKETLSRIAACLWDEKDALPIAVADGFHLSVDNAHANHPNHPELSDPTTDVRLGGGIVLKYNAAQHYTTDGYSAAVVKRICSLAELPYQEFTNRSDLRGGSTLGNISNSEISFAGADIGIPQLAMHSAVETCAKKDIEQMAQFIRCYYVLA